MSTCYDQCAVNWPPLLLAEGQELSGGAGVIGDIGIIEREDGGSQITYDGWPLYYWVKDSIPGDTTGHLVNDVWFVATPKEQITQSPAPSEDGDSNY